MTDWNQAVVEEFRANGKSLARIEGHPGPYPPPSSSRTSPRRGSGRQKGGCHRRGKTYTVHMDSISFWINPAILVGIGTVLWRSQVKRFDRIDTQLLELTREVVANGKSIARIEGRHEGHPGPVTDPPGPRSLTQL